MIRTFRWESKGFFYWGLIRKLLLLIFKLFLNFFSRNYDQQSYLCTRFCIHSVSLFLTRRLEWEISGPRSAKRSELGNIDANGSSDSKVLEGVQVSRPCLVLPSRHLPNHRLHRRRCRLGNRSQARQRLTRCHSEPPQKHRDRPFLPRNSSGKACY